MLEACSAPGGTATEVSIPGYELAGKTGTANKVDPATGEYSKTPTSPRSWASRRRRDPKLLCAVIVDEPQPARSSAARSPRPRSARS